MGKSERYIVRVQVLGIRSTDSPKVILEIDSVSDSDLPRAVTVAQMAVKTIDKAMSNVPRWSQATMANEGRQPIAGHKRPWRPRNATMPENPQGEERREFERQQMADQAAHRARRPRNERMGESDADSGARSDVSEKA